MKKSLSLLLIVILCTTALTAQTVVGKLVNQNGEGVSGLQLSLYIHPKVFASVSQADGSFTFSSITGIPILRLPTGYDISDNYPNPFNRNTRIKITLANEGKVKIDIYNLNGQKMLAEINDQCVAGEHYFDFSFDGLSSGIYLAMITFDDRFTAMKKMVFQKENSQIAPTDINVATKSDLINNSAGETKIDSIVVKGASINKKVFPELPGITEGTLNLGNLTVTEINNLLDGAVSYKGTIPDIGLVSYHNGENTVSDSAYLGQAVLLMNPEISSNVAATIVKANGGKVLAQIPNAGYYLAEVATGQEGSFIDKLNAYNEINTAMPNIVANYMSAGINYIDDCNGSHGSAVYTVLLHNSLNGTALKCLDDDAENNPGKPFVPSTINQLLTAIKEANGGNVIVNISSFGGVNNGADYNDLQKDSQEMLISKAYNYLKEILSPISILGENWTENLVITLCAGNDNVPLTQVLDSLRKDILIENILKNNILIVGAKESVYHNSNDAPNDPEFANMRTVTDISGNQGTSLAAPLAAAYISNLIDNKGITARQALQAAKIAVATNSEGEFLEGDAQIVAESIKKSTGVVGIYSGGPFSLNDLSPRGDCTLHFTMDVRITVSLIGDEAAMSVPAHFSYYIRGEECEIDVYPDDRVFKGSLDVSNGVITGTAETVFHITDGIDDIPFEANATMHGILNANGTITGNLTIASHFINQSTGFTLNKL